MPINHLLFLITGSVPPISAIATHEATEATGHGVGRGGAFVKSMTLNWMVVDSTPALAAT